MSSYPDNRPDPGTYRRFTGGKLPCPIAGCGKTRPQGRLMCITCWWRVPADLRVLVYKTWRTYLQATQPSSAVSRKANAVEAFTEYRKAKEAAIAAATRTPLTSTP